MKQLIIAYKNNGKWDNSDKITNSNIWFVPDNHGVETARDFMKLDGTIQDELYEFLGNLPLFLTLKSEEKNDNSFAIIHAYPPRDIMNTSHVPTLSQIVNEQKFNVLRSCLTIRKGKNNINEIGIPDAITVIGHTPTDDVNGFAVIEDGRVLMIDGGCAYMAENPNYDGFYPKSAVLVNLSNEKGKTVAQPFAVGDNEYYGQDLRESIRHK